MRALLLLPVVACVCGCEVSVNSSAGLEASIPPASHDVAPPAMPGWTIAGAGGHAYEAVVDPEVAHGGHATIRFHPIQDAGGSYATYMTSLDAAPLRGRRAHAVVWVRTEGITGRGDVWMRAQGADSSPQGPGLAYTAARLAPSADFMAYELFADVPVDATQVQLGVGIGGPGRLWIDGVKVEAQ